MQLIMTKPSPQLIRSAAVSALAMAAFALSSPQIEPLAGTTVAAVELPSLTGTAQVSFAN